MDELYMYENFAIVIAAIPVAVICITVFVKIFGFVRNLFADKTEYEAVVFEKKKTTEYRNTNSSKQGYNIPYRLDIYFLTFRTEKHKKLKLKVDSGDYYSVKEGDRGILTLQGKKFISFRGSGIRLNNE